MKNEKTKRKIAIFDNRKNFSISLNFSQTDKVKQTRKKKASL